MSSPEPSGLPDANVRVIPPASVSIILAALTVYGGSVTDQNTISEGVVVGGCFVILCLAFIHSISPGFADTFALLLFVVIFLKYGLGILQAIGVAASGSDS